MAKNHQNSNVSEESEILHAIKTEEIKPTDEVGKEVISKSAIHKESPVKEKTLPPQNSIPLSQKRQVPAVPQPDNSFNGMVPEKENKSKQEDIPRPIDKNNPSLENQQESEMESQIDIDKATEEEFFVSKWATLLNDEGVLTTIDITEVKRFEALSQEDIESTFSPEDLKKYPELNVGIVVYKTFDSEEMGIDLFGTSHAAFKELLQDYEASF